VTPRVELSNTDVGQNLIDLILASTIPGQHAGHHRGPTVAGRAAELRR
jgi:hypothetical protein